MQNATDRWLFYGLTHVYLCRDILHRPTNKKAGIIAGLFCKLMKNQWKV